MIPKKSSDSHDSFLIHRLNLHTNTLHCIAWDHITSHDITCTHSTSECIYCTYIHISSSLSVLLHLLLTSPPISKYIHNCSYCPSIYIYQILSILSTIHAYISNIWRDIHPHPCAKPPTSSRMDWADVWMGQLLSSDRSQNGKPKRGEIGKPWRKSWMYIHV